MYYYCYTGKIWLFLWLLMQPTSFMPGMLRVSEKWSQVMSDYLKCALQLLYFTWTVYFCHKLNLWSTISWQALLHLTQWNVSLLLFTNEPLIALSVSFLFNLMGGFGYGSLQLNCVPHCKWYKFRPKNKRIWTCRNFTLYIPITSCLLTIHMTCHYIRKLLSDCR